ncbi:hypothetical protein L6R49_25940, partial [Myxococcota bacterium]|nr:hypothetical protein [Myxococcota bacterium]
MSPTSRVVLLCLLALNACVGDKSTGDDTAAENRAPSAPIITLTGGTTGEDLVADMTVASTDADGDPISYTWAWTLDGAAQADLTTETVPADRLARGQVWSVTVTPNDGLQDGPSASAETTIANGLPSVTLTLTPAELTTDSTVTALIGGADPDGDVLSFEIQWLVNDTVVASDVESISGVDYFDKGDTVQVVVTATDSEGGSTTAESALLEVGNIAPSAPVVAIEPDAPVAGSAFQCLVVEAASDGDGEELLYSIAWTRDGVAFTDNITTSLPGDTVPSGVAVAGEVWTCTVTASDGDEEGEAAIATVTISAWTGPRLFTPCGATGQSGPDQTACDSAYLGSTLEGEVSVGAGIQSWTAPFTGDFRVQACGAQGAAAATGYVGGKGACVEGTFTLTGGEVYLIAVGQVGSGQSSESNGGGGGGSFFVAVDDTPLLIAGGGGGTRASVTSDGCDALATEFGVQGSGGSESWTCPALTSGAGEGGAASSYSWGSGGGGFYSDGDKDDNGGANTAYGVGGKSWFNGLTGGDNAGYDCGFIAYGG